MNVQKRKLRDIGGYVVALLAPVIWLHELLSPDEKYQVSRKRYQRLPTYRRRHERRRYIRDMRRSAFEYPSDSLSLLIAIVLRKRAWGLLILLPMVLTMVLAFVAGVAKPAIPALAVPISVLIAVMCMALPNYSAMWLKTGLLYYRVVERIYSRISEDPEHRIRRRDAFILYIARPSNVEGVVGIFFGLFGYVIGHYTVWGEF